MLEDAAHPHDGRRLKLLEPDLAAREVRRTFDPLRGVDEDKAVAEPAMEEDGNGSDRQPAVARHEIRGARDFGHVEVAIAQEAPVPRGRIHVGEDVEINSFRLDLTVGEGAHDLVIAAGEGKLEVGQERFPLVPVSSTTRSTSNPSMIPHARELTRRSRGRRAAPRDFPPSPRTWPSLGTGGCHGDANDAINRREKAKGLESP